MNKNNWMNSNLKQTSRPAGPFSGTSRQLQNILNEHHIILKTPEQIEGIRAACYLTAKILKETCDMAKEGVSLIEINDFCHRLHLEAGARPAPLGYGHPPFPKSICTSINDVICHGIPDRYVLKKGDIVNIDVSCEYKGYYGDCSRMVTIGPLNEERQRVVDVSYECLMNAIDVVRPGNYVSDIGVAIETHAKKNRCSVVDVFVGHGLGLGFHEGPEIPHHYTNLHIPFVPGMTFTIEPMINAGTKHAVIDIRDQWTARTRDGKASAQWEHSLLVTEFGVEILTPWQR